MNERQRMQYLNALGVDAFVPRWVLPGARPSFQCAPSSVPNVCESAEVETRSAQAPVGALVDRLLGDEQEPQKTEPAPTTARLEPAESVPSPEKAAFSLTFWRVHPQVMVVDSRQPKALPTEALLRSVVLAFDLGSTLPAGEVQSWPLPGISDTGWDAARETIQAFLEGRLLSQPVRFLVLMGEDAARAVLPPEADTSRSRVPLDAFACDALLTPSLSDLLLNPPSKALLWRLLAPLRQELHES